MARMTFYRKYRSQSFDEMVGQTHIIQTLSNAISNKRLSHAYIFSGPRGTGKTSAARIFAKAVNVFEQEGQFNKLDNSLSQRISSGVCVDIVEIDAASNTGVDNIRDLNDKVNFTPVECAYKFYIIDEVHMLSTGAFNALLKTLEEPPSHTIFVLATTEPHKIPVTIHSRCQHLRFRNLSDSEIISRLKLVCEQENITMSDNSCAIIAQNSSGCMRDALSLLDQIYSFKGTSISDEDVVTILGACSIELTNKLVDALFEKQSDELVRLLNSTFQNGINPLQLLKDLVFTVENILSFKSGAVELVKYNIPFIKETVPKVSIKVIVECLDCLATIESETRWFSNPALLMQIKLVQFTVSDESLNLNSQTNKISVATQKNTPSNSTQSLKPQQPINPVKNIANQPVKKSINLETQKKETQDVSTYPVSKNSFSMPQPIVNDDVADKLVSSPQISSDQDQPLNFENCLSKWNSFLVKLKSMHTGLFTILRQSTIVSLEGGCIEIKLHQPVQFFVEKLTEQTYRQLLNNYLEEYFKSKLSFKIHELKSNSTQISINNDDENSLSPKKNEPEDSIKANPTKEHSLNEIISMFEGKVL